MTTIREQLEETHESALSIASALEGITAELPEDEAAMTRTILAMFHAKMEAATGTDEEFEEAMSLLISSRSPSGIMLAALYLRHTFMLDFVRVEAEENTTTETLQ